LSPETDAHRPPHGRNGRRGLKIALLCSLAVNLALLGFVAGRLGPPGGQRPALDPVRAFVPFLRELPQSRRDELRPLLRERLAGRRGDLQRLREVQQDVRRALTAEPFDAGELAGALASQRALLGAHHRVSHETFVALVSRLSAAERKALSERLRQGRGRPGPAGGPPPLPSGPAAGSGDGTR